MNNENPPPSNGLGQTACLQVCNPPTCRERLENERDHLLTRLGNIQKLLEELKASPELDEKLTKWRDYLY